MQLQSLMDDPGLKDNTGLQKTLLRTFARIMPNAEPKFRENCECCRDVFEYRFLCCHNFGSVILRFSALLFDML